MSGAANYKASSAWRRAPDISRFVRDTSTVSTGPCRHPGFCYQGVFTYDRRACKVRFDPKGLAQPSAQQKMALAKKIQIYGWPDDRL